MPLDDGQSVRGGWDNARYSSSKSNDLGVEIDGYVKTWAWEWTPPFGLGWGPPLSYIHHRL